MGIFINFAQILAILSSFELRWPPSIISLFDVFSITSLNLDLLATDCNVGLPYHQKWLITMGLPLVIVAVLFLLTLLSHTVSLVGKSGIPFSLLLTAIVALASFAYMLLAAKAVEFFACTRQDDGRYLLNADPSLECYDDWWMALLPAAAGAVILYVLGIPAVFAGIMFKYRNTLEDTRSSGFAVFGVISSRFQPKHAYYELVVMMRKLAILIALLMVSDSPPIQAFIAQIALVLGLAVHQKIQPYNSKELNAVESALLVAALCVLSAGQVFYTSESPFLVVVVIILIAGCTLAVVAVAFYAVAFRHTFINKVSPGQHPADNPDNRGTESSKSIQMELFSSQDEIAMTAETPMHSTNGGAVGQPMVRTTSIPFSQASSGARVLSTSQDGGLLSPTSDSGFGDALTPSKSVDALHAQQAASSSRKGPRRRGRSPSYGKRARRNGPRSRPNLSKSHAVNFLTSTNGGGGDGGGGDGGEDGGDDGGDGGGDDDDDFQSSYSTCSVSVRSMHA